MDLRDGYIKCDGLNNSKLIRKIDNNNHKSGGGGIVVLSHLNIVPIQFQRITNKLPNRS